MKNAWLPALIVLSSLAGSSADGQQQQQQGIYNPYLGGGPNAANPLRQSLMNYGRPDPNRIIDVSVQTDKGLPQNYPSTTVSQVDNVLSQSLGSIGRDRPVQEVTITIHIHVNKIPLMR